MKKPEQILLSVTESHTGTGYTAPCLIEAMEEYANQFKPQWITIDLEDEETLPNDFEPVLCWTKDNNLQMLMMLKYGNDPENNEWETQGLKKNQAFNMDYVTKWLFIEDPE